MRKQLALITLASALMSGHALADMDTVNMLRKAHQQSHCTSYSFETLANTVQAPSRRDAVDAVASHLLTLKSAKVVAGAIASFVNTDNALGLSVAEAYAARTTPGASIELMAALALLEKDPECTLGALSLVEAGKALLNGMHTAGASFDEMAALAAVLGEDSAEARKLLTYITDVLGVTPDELEQRTKDAATGSEA